jgi:anaerobic dimethyl sulfoxide reductase subunit A
MKTLPVFCGKDCGGNACPLLLEIEGDRGTRILHNPAGAPHIRACRRGFGLLRAHYAPDRLSAPLIRTGARGSTSFREANWDEALDTVVARLSEVRSRHGSSSVLCLGSAGSLGALHNTATLTKRFLNTTGGCATLTGSYSNGAARAVLPFMLGPQWQTSGFDAATMRSSTMVILWGANVLEARLGSELSQRLMEAKKRGATIVAIDPRRTSTVARASTWWIPCRPGTDSALMLATLHELLEDGRVDITSVNARAVGFEKLSRYVLGEDDGRPRNPAWAAPICGVPASEIRRFALAYADARPVMLIPGFSIQRVFAGEDSYRLAVALQLATGNFGVRGGSCGSMNNSLPTPRVGTMAPLIRPDQPGVPMLLWPDAILSSGKSGQFPAIHAAYVAGCNFVNQGADVHKSIAAFDRLDFAVCHDLFLTPTARQCDVVLPAASPLEKEDIGIPWLGNYLLYKAAALPPRGSARSDWDIFFDLADRMGAGREFSGGRTASQWIDSFLESSEVPDHEQFKSTGVYLAPDQERVGLAAFGADPAGHPLDTPSGKVEISSECYARETGFSAFPVWRNQERDVRYPLSLITPKHVQMTHSQYGDRRSGLSPESHDFAMHPADAAERGIQSGAQVRLFNEHGAVHVRVRVTDDIMAGVVCLHEGTWFELDDKGADTAGSANLLTGTVGTGPEDSCIMHAIAVEVALLPSGEGAPP